MVSLDAAKSLLATPLDNDNGSPPERDQAAYMPLHRFDLEPNRQYQQQFGDMYFLRLAKIKPWLVELADSVFSQIPVGGEHAKKVERVLDVRQGELCWVVGTVYMDMPFKPSILEDVSKDKLLSKPSAVKKYVPEDDDDILAEGRGSVATMLEDDSGRVRLVGKELRSKLLVTGCVIAAMGSENENGEFEVAVIVFPEVPAQPERWHLSKPLPASGENGHAGEDELPAAKRAKVAEAEKSGDVDTDMDGAGGRSGGGGGKKIAIVSGLNFLGPHGPSAVETALLLEFLLGASLTPALQREAAHIGRLIIAGNSIVSADGPEAQASAAAQAAEAAQHGNQQHKKYGYDSSSFNPVPSQLLDAFLAELLPSMPVTLMPGEHDSANASLPQQPVHPAMFPKARVFAAPRAPGGAAPAQPGWLDTVTNPWEGEVEGWRFLGTSGQTIDDIQKYVLSSDRLAMMEATARWQCCAPTAPDTLWSYPFQEDDPFVLDACPHVYFAGSQPEFGTKVIYGSGGETVRLIAVPAFSETKEVVLLDTETLEVTLVKIGQQ